MKNAPLEERLLLLENKVDTLYSMIPGIVADCAIIEQDTKVIRESVERITSIQDVMRLQIGELEISKQEIEFSGRSIQESVKKLSDRIKDSSIYPDQT